MSFWQLSRKVSIACLGHICFHLGVARLVHTFIEAERFVVTFPVHISDVYGAQHDRQLRNW